MRNASPALVALLNGSDQVLVADCLTLVLVDGTTLRLTAADADVVLDTRTFTAGVPFQRTKTRLSIGLDVDSLTLTLWPRAGRDALLGRPWPAAVADGVLDGARVVVERAFFAAPDTPAVGALIQFGGRVGQASPARSSILCEVQSDLELLAQPSPRHVYQAGCLHTLFDNGCALSKIAWTYFGTVGAGGDVRTVVPATLARDSANALGAADGFFDLGTVTFTSGVNAGVTRAVQRWASGRVALGLPLRTAPAVGDTFTMSPGCDKTQATCSAKFQNLGRFRGYPYTPKPEALR